MKFLLQKRVIPLFDSSFEQLPGQADEKFRFDQKIATNDRAASLIRHLLNSNNLVRLVDL